MRTYKKILIAEDQDSIAEGVKKCLEQTPAQITHEKYCDDAWLKMKKAHQDNDPYDLLITDLSFKPDHRNVTLKHGEDLLEMIKKQQFDCKVIVFSIEDRPMRVRKLMSDFNIQGFVLKGRNDSNELGQALEAVAKGKTYVSDKIKEIIHLKRSISQIENIDLEIIKYLCQGKTQDEIHQILKTKEMKPNSVSSIEKRLKNLRIDFSAKTNIELVVVFKDLGLI